MFIKSEWVKPASDLQILLAKKFGTEVIGMDEDGTKFIAYKVGDHIYVTDIVYKEKEMEQKSKFKAGDKVRVVKSGLGVSDRDMMKETVILSDADFSDSMGPQYLYSTAGFDFNYRKTYGDGVCKAYEKSFELIEPSSEVVVPYHSITYDNGNTKIHIDGKLSRETVDGIVKLLHENRMA